jgi:hypothetical protein
MQVPGHPRQVTQSRILHKIVDKSRRLPVFLYKGIVRLAQEDMRVGSTGVNNLFGDKRRIAPSQNHEFSIVFPMPGYFGVFRAKYLPVEGHQREMNG